MENKAPPKLSPMSEREIKLLAAAYIAEVMEKGENITTKDTHATIARITGLTTGSARVMLVNAKKHCKTLREAGEPVFDYGGRQSGSGSAISTPKRPTASDLEMPATPGGADFNIERAASIADTALQSPTRAGPKKRGRNTQTAEPAHDDAATATTTEANPPPKRVRRPSSKASESMAQRSRDAVAAGARRSASAAAVDQPSAGREAVVVIKKEPSVADNE